MLYTEPLSQYGSMTEFEGVLQNLALHYLKCLHAGDKLMRYDLIGSDKCDNKVVVIRSSTTWMLMPNVVESSGPFIFWRHLWTCSIKFDEVSASCPQCAVKCPFQDRYKVIWSMQELLLFTYLLVSRFSSEGFRLLLDIWAYKKHLANSIRISHMKFMTWSGKRYPQNEAVSVAQWRIIRKSGKVFINEAETAE